MNTNKIFHRKLASEPVPNSCQIPQSRRVETSRGTHERFIQMSLPSIDTEQDEEEESPSDTENLRESTSARETSVKQVETSVGFAPSTQIGRGRPKLTRSWSPISPGERNPKLH